MKIDYNNKEWDINFYYDESCSSGLRWLVNSGYKHFGDIAGSKAYSDKLQTKPKCWDVRFENKLYKVHRIIWILHNGEIDNDLVINHKDNNPFNNKIKNLELVEQTLNMRRTSCHTWLMLQSNNTSGINGVATFLNKDGSIRAYSAVCRALNGEVKNFSFSVSRYGEQLALELAKQARDYFIKELNKNEAGYPTQDNVYL
jgi:hypothetical protein